MKNKQNFLSKQNIKVPLILDKKKQTRKIVIK